MTHRNSSDHTCWCKSILCRSAYSQGRGSHRMEPATDRSRECGPRRSLVSRMGSEWGYAARRMTGHKKMGRRLEHRSGKGRQRLPEGTSWGQGQQSKLRPRAEPCCELLTSSAGASMLRQRGCLMHVLVRCCPSSPSQVALSRSKKGGQDTRRHVRASAPSFSTHKHARAAALPSSPCSSSHDRPVAQQRRR